MPRRHPQEDDKKTGPSPTVIAERRRLREERREKKSPGEDKAALLTVGERRVLASSIRDLQAGSSAEADRQIGSLQRELDRDDESRRSGRRRGEDF